MTGVLLAFIPFFGMTQERSALDSLYDELEVMFEDADLPVGLLEKADSLMQLMDLKYHSIGLRTGYMSNVLTAGRDLGIDQHGFNTGLSYFHPSGMYADFAGYWNSEYDPTYYLTNLGIGYWHNFNNHWTVSIGHDFMLYDEKIDFLFDKSARASVFYQRKNWEAGLDYRYLYGQEKANRLVGIFNGRINWKNVGFIDRITLIPGATIQYGNSDVLYYRQSETPLQDLYRVLREGSYPPLTDREFVKLSYMIYQGYDLRAYQFLREKGFTNGEIQKLYNDYESNLLVSDNSYGVMNIALNAALSISEKNWNLFINYTYNFPQALPGETYEYPKNDYVSISLMYTFLWAAK